MQRDTTTVRIDREAHEALRSLAEEDGVSQTEELRRLVEKERRRRLFEQADRAYRELSPEECEGMEHERSELEGTLEDGLAEYE